MYRSGHARLFLAERGYTSIGRPVDTDYDPKAQGISMSGFCNNDLERSVINEKGFIEIDGVELRNVFLLANSDTLSSLVRYLLEYLDTHGSDGVRLKLNIIVIPGDEGTHQQARDKFRVW